MNYMTGQAMAYLGATIVGVIALGIFLTFMLGGSLTYKGSTKTIESISHLLGSTLTR